jgi:hypothetical protein
MSKVLSLLIILLDSLFCKLLLKQKDMKRDSGGMGIYRSTTGDVSPGQIPAFAGMT